MIRPETLLYLDEIAKMHSITRAAESLYLSKSSLSAAIKNLENELGVSLLKRSSYGVELTAAGEMVVKKSKIILELFDQLKAECWIYEDNKIEEITCVMTESFANNIFPDLIRKLRQISGGARIKTLRSNLEGMIEYVKNDETTIGFYISSQNISKEILDDKVIANEINGYKLWAVTAKYSRYIDDDVKEITLEELFKYPLIGYSCDDLEEIYRNKYYTGSSAHVLVTDNMNIYNQAVCDDIGIGFMLGIALQSKSMQKNLLRKIYIKDMPESKLYLLTNVDCPPEIRAKYERVLLALEE